MIKYLKNLFSKKETQFANQKKSDQEFFIENIKEMDLSINKKIEELIRRKFCLSNDEVLDSRSLTIDFGCDYIDLYELISEIEHIFDIKVQDGGFQLNVGEIKEYVRKKIENPNYIVSDKNSHIDLWPQSLEQILNEEHLYARSLAIKAILENDYQILEDESGNPFKELINFTLKYFEGYFVEKPIEAEILLKNSFPTMHLYIKRQIANQQNEITNIISIDDQNAYDEFLLFCKNAICSLYADKSIRDQQIKHHFKIFHNALIQFIDSEQAK